MLSMQMCPSGSPLIKQEDLPGHMELASGMSLCCSTWSSKAYISDLDNNEFSKFLNMRSALGMTHVKQGQAGIWTFSTKMGSLSPMTAELQEISIKILKHVEQETYASFKAALEWQNTTHNEKINVFVTCERKGDKRGFIFKYWALLFHRKQPR